MTFKDIVERARQVEDNIACKHCGRVIFAGPPCCYQKACDLWQKSEREVQWLRKVQSKMDKRIRSLLKELDEVKVSHVSQEEK